MIKADVTLDVVDKVCPIPAKLTQKRLERMAAGAVLEAIVGSPTAKDSVIRLSKDLEHEVLQTVEERGTFRIYIKKMG